MLKANLKKSPLTHLESAQHGPGIIATTCLAGSLAQFGKVRSGSCVSYIKVSVVLSWKQPSLKQTDLSKLKNEFTIGVNRIYLAFPEMGFSTTYLISVNTLVLEQCVDDFKNLALPRFLTWRARSWFSQSMIEDPNLMFLDTDYTGEAKFSGDATGRLFEGFTVTFVALQLAFFMGFDEVILIGVDHNFTTQGPANTTVVSGGDDLNHFAANYFGKGFRWQLPDLEGSERAYVLAREAYAKAGRQVLDATIAGKLTVFPKVSYEKLF
jgi:hypothetical protein